MGPSKTTEKNVWASSNIFPLRGGIFAAYIAFTDFEKKRPVYHIKTICIGLGPNPNFPLEVILQ